MPKSHPEPSKLGQRLRRAREARGYTQAQLGNHASLSRCGIAVNDIETGRTQEPRRERVEVLARALEVPTDWLYGHGPERVPRRRSQRANAEAA